MGIIRPTTADSGDRWAIALADAPDGLLIGTRADVLAFSEAMTHGDVLHLIYRRPGRDADWQLVQGAAT
jgi:hypothetical protein